MERESFEDLEVAELLNQNFIAVKVDREERPDVDQIYMSVCQALTGQGGWPLTIIMTPEQRPFFAGTYFPKHSKYGRPGLMDVLEQIAQLWQSEQPKLLEIGNQLTSKIQAEVGARPGTLPADVLDKAYQLFLRSYDTRYGGFGDAPKFPTPHNLMLLLRYWKKTGEPKALSMVEETLDSMHRGGIYDHVGFGFARYSTDRQWLVPHFEKMLYDNALLAMAYLETYQINRNARFGRIAKEIFTYVLRDMTSPEGAFFSAEDADSEGAEGKFYVWQPREVYDILGPIDGELFCRYYDITEEGNFEGAGIPNLIHQDPVKFAGELDIDLKDLVEGLEKCRKILFTEREKRIHPHKDDKILTSWNGLMIAALAMGGRILGDEQYTRAAARAMKFIEQSLRRQDGRLLARYRQGEAAYPAYLEDYAFAVWGLLELYASTYESAYVQRAMELTEDMIELFFDRENGGFFFYGKDSEQLLSRPKEIYDGAIPSGNSAATVNLLRLARLTGNDKYQQIAEKQFRTFAGNLGSYPAGHAFFLVGAYLNQEAPLEIVLSGKNSAPDLKHMIAAVQQKFLPNAAILVRLEDQINDQVESLLPLLKEKAAQGGKATAYVCKNLACRPPVTNLKQLLEIIS